MIIKIPQINVLDIIIVGLSCYEGILCIANFCDASASVNHILYICNYILIATIIISLIKKGISEHFIPISFFTCFLVFLMGQKPFERYYNVYLTFVRVELNTSQYAIFAAILFFGISITYISYILFYYNSKKNINDSINSTSFLPIKPLIQTLFWITLPCALYMQLKIVIVRGMMTYTEGYLVNVDVPSLIKVGYYIFSGIILIYFAMKPSKKEVYMLCFFYLLIEGGMQIFQGRRALLASTLLFIMWYLFKYYGIKKINMEYLFRIIMITIGMIILFYIIEQVRSGSNSNELSLELFKNFFISTGGSDSVIANTIVRSDKFPQKGWMYLFDPFINNPIRNFILKIESFPQGISYIKAHNSFPDWISYLTDAQLYITGHGMGSCYLAEVYLAFGLGGIIAVSIILGKVLQILNGVSLQENVYRTAFMFYVVKNLFTLPRSGLFSWVGNLPYLLFVFMMIYPFYVRYCRK